MTQFNKCYIFHEIGHAIIGLIFEGYLMKVEKIILNKEDIKRLKLNTNDIAYTHQKIVNIEQNEIDENEYLYAMINGLNFLSGIAGATYLCHEFKPIYVEVTSENFFEVLNTAGAYGDFEYINGKQIIYSWYLFDKKRFNQLQAFEVHSFLMNILQDIFLDDRIRMVSSDIYEFIVNNPDTNVEYIKLVELFSRDLIAEFKNKSIATLQNIIG
jgi:hypothetical protein